MGRGEIGARGQGAFDAICRFRSCIRKEAGMALGVLVKEKKHRGGPRGHGRWALAGLMLSSASCVPVSASQGPAAASSAPAPAAAAAEAAPAAAPATAPVLAPIVAPAAAAARLAYAGRTELD